MSNNGILQAKNTKYLPANTTTYNITQDDDFIFVDTSLNAVTLVLPNIRNGLLIENPKCFKINDYTGNAAVNNITVVGCGGDSVNSGNSFTMSSNYESVETNVVNQDEWFLSSSIGNTVVSGFVPYTGATQSVDLGNYGLTTYNLVVGQQQGGYVTSGNHKAQIVADSATQTPLTVIGGSGAIEFWKDNTPTKAVSFGMAVAGSPVTDNFILSTFDGATWTQRMSVANSNGDLTIGTSSAFYGGYYNITGTAGAGYIAYISQSTTPATPATGFNLYGGSSNTVNWISPNGFITRLDSTANTNDRTYTFPDASGTIALTSSLSGYVPYTGATQNVNLGIYSLISPTIYGSTSASGTLTIDSTSNATKGLISSTSQWNIGNASANPSTTIGLVRIGQNNGIVDIGSIATGYSTIWLGQSTPSTTNYSILMAGSTALTLQASSSVGISVNGGSGLIQLTSGGLFSVSPQAQTGGAVTNFTFTSQANTGQTASTNIPNFKVTGSTKTWAAGALATQYFNYFSANTVAFASASTADEVYGMYIEGSTAGTNATITNNFALGLLSGTSTIKMGNLTGSTTLPAIYLNQATPSNTNYALAAISASAIRLNAPAGGSLNFSIGAANYMVGDATGWTYSTPVTVAATYSHFTWSPSNRTNQTASTEVNSYLFNSFTTTWAAGNITTQRFLWFKTPTAAFSSGSNTISESYSAYIEAATAGTNATITNNFALGLLAGTATIKFGNVTGSTTDPAIYFNQASPSSSNYTFQVSSGFAIFNAGTNAVLRVANATKINAGSTSTAFTQGIASSGAVTTYDFTLPSNTGQTAGTEASGVKFTNATRTWAAGAITTQREFYITSPTYAFASASTITNSYGLYVEAATAGTNATITNNWAAGFSGSVYISEGLSLGYVSKTAAYTITNSDYTVECTSGTFNVTLPTAVGRTGRVYVVMNSGAGTITLDTTSSQTINGALTQTIATNQSVTVQSNGSNWIIL